MPGPDAMLLGLDENQRIDPQTGKGFVAQPQQQAPSVQHASLSGPGPSFSTPPQAERGHPDDRVGMMKTNSAQGVPRQAQAVRPLNSDELLAKANEMLDSHRVQSQTILGQGASTGNTNDAGGKMPEWLTDYMKDDQ